MRDAQEHLVRAVVETVRPFVKRLLNQGVPFGRLERRLRDLFVEVAGKELALPGRPATDSRIALLTGINRKEVKRMRSADRGVQGPSSFSLNLCTSLISRWTTDPGSTDRSGRPVPLPYQAERGPSFTELARKVTADIAPRVLLDELLRTGAARMLEGNRVELTADAYVPRVGDPENLQILAEDPAELVETMLRNIFSEWEEPLLQRKVYYDNLGSRAAKRVRAQMRREGERFLRKINRLLARHDRDRNPRAAGGDRYYAAMGVYFYETKPRPTPPREETGKQKEK